MSSMDIYDSIPKLRGAFELVVTEQGRITGGWHDRNLIVTVGKDALARLLGGNRNDHVVKIGFGTNGTAPTDANTTLTGAYIRAIQDTRYSGYSGTFYGAPVTVAAGQVRFEWFVDNAEANGLTIREFGLLFNDETLFARHCRPAVGATPDTITKHPDMTLHGSWTIYMGV